MKAIKQALLSALAIGTLSSAGTGMAEPPADPDKAAVAAIVQRIYQGYNAVSATGEYGVDDGQSSFAYGLDGYAIPMTKSLKALIIKWDKALPDDEAFEMNSFDWYCQCQDWDKQSAKVIAESYDIAEDNRINASVDFSAGLGTQRKTVFRFIKSDGDWQIDDLIFQDGNNLRKGLEQDIAGAALTNAT